MQAVQLSRTHRILVGVVVTGAVVIAAIGFAGSYAAVRELAVSKGFGWFAPFFPIGIDAGIVVLLALDLLLTWIRIPFPLLRQTAWLLTAATIAFNGAAAWPDPLGVGMHAVIPVLFVVSVEAARHAIGRIADITADRHMEGVRIARWLLAFPSTFRLWRRMKLWELRSYDQVIRMEQDRLVYEARLHARFGRGWRRKAPVEALMPLRLARYGVPLTETGPAGLASAGITEPLRATTPRPALPGGHESGARGEYTKSAAPGEPAAGAADVPRTPYGGPQDGGEPGAVRQAAAAGNEYAVNGHAHRKDAGGAVGPQPDPATPAAAPAEGASDAGDRPPTGEQTPLFGDGYQADMSVGVPNGVDGHRSGVTVPVGPGRRRALGEPVDQPDDGAGDPVGIPDGIPREEVYFEAYRQFVATEGGFPTARQLSRTLNDGLGVTRADGSLLSETYLRRFLREFRERYNNEMGLAG